MNADPVWLPEVLRAAGITCHVYPGAMNNGHGDFATIWGIVAHHTGSPAGSTPGPGYIANHPTLGLASQLYLGRDGEYTLCGVGQAWHAGNGSWPGIPRNAANKVTLGIEAENSGTEGWSPAQYNAYVRGVAAILNHLGLPETRVIAHREWYYGQKISPADARAGGGKWDPGGIDMDDFRSDVAVQQEALRAGKASGGDSETWGAILEWLSGQPSHS